MIKMLQAVGDYLQPILDWLLYWVPVFCQWCFLILSNPIIITLIAIYFLYRFARWYIPREREKKEVEYLTKPPYEELEKRLLEKEEELRALRRKIRARAFRD
jgi:hypothetical protein